MTSNKRWDDWLDDERISKTGVFSVHRNYIGGNGQYLYSRYQRSKDRSMNPSHNQGDKVEPIYIGDTSPIATGITAYFVCDYLNLRCLKYYLENQQVYKTEIFYLRYLNYCIQPELNKNNMLPNPDTSENKPLAANTFGTPFAVPNVPASADWLFNGSVKSISIT